MYWPSRDFTKQEERYGPWRRSFALLPHECKDCKGHYWLEYGWRRRDYLFSVTNARRDHKCILCMPLTALANHGVREH